MSLRERVNMMMSTLAEGVVTPKLVDSIGLDAFTSALMSFYNSKLKNKLETGGYVGTAQDLKNEIDKSVAPDIITPQEIQEIINGLGGR